MSKGPTQMHKPACETGVTKHSAYSAEFAAPAAVLE